MSKNPTDPHAHCDVCRQELPLEADGCRCGELVANWGAGAMHPGEQYRLCLCENCFFYALSTLRRARCVATMFDDEGWPDVEDFGRVDLDPSATKR